MTVKGLCPEVCEECKLSLQEAVDRVDNTEGIVSPQGFLSWVLRTKIADAQDAAQEKKQHIPEQDTFGRTIERVKTMEELINEITAPKN